MSEPNPIPPHVALFFAALGAYWPERFKPTAESLEAWAPHLAPFPTEALAACAKRLAFRDDWPPSFARCLEVLCEAPLRELGAPQFEVAFADVLRRVCDHTGGGYAWDHDLARQLHRELGRRTLRLRGHAIEARALKDEARELYGRMRIEAREELVGRAKLGEVPDSVLLAGLDRRRCLLEIAAEPGGC